jgi:hypothetical protein
MIVSADCQWQQVIRAAKQEVIWVECGKATVVHLRYVMFRSVNVISILPFQTAFM